MTHTNFLHSHRRHLQNISAFCLFVLMAVLFLAYPARTALAQDAKVDPAAAETKIGAEEVKKFDADKNTKFVKDQAVIDRIQKIGNELADIANKTQIPAEYGKSDLYKFGYTFKVLDDKDVNAFSLPGGFIYINKGLIDYAQSDDEIAGVIGHELAHVAHHHAMQLMATDNKQSIGVMMAVLAAALSGAKSDTVFGVFQVGQLLQTARLNGYGQKAEFDADKTAVNYLSHTKYNPVGIFTMMQRLAMDEARKPEITLGICANHPPSQERAQRLISETQRLGLPINTRLVTNYSEVQVKPVDKSPASSIWIGKTEIIRLGDTKDAKAADRAGKIASVLKEKLFAGAKYHDIRLNTMTNSVSIMRDDVISPAPEDAALAGTTVEELSKATSIKVKQALMDEMLQAGF